MGLRKDGKPRSGVLRSTPKLGRVGLDSIVVSPHLRAEGAPTTLLDGDVVKDDCPREKVLAMAVFRVLLFTHLFLVTSWIRSMLWR